MSTITDDFSPVSVGDTAAPFNPTFQYSDGTAVNLAGATITMKLQGISAGNSGTTTTCTGIWSITDAPNGKASYAYTSADVATAGLWNMFITITISGKPVHADTKILQILAVA